MRLQHVDFKKPGKSEARRTGKCAGREGETWRSHWPSHLSMASCFTLPSSVGRTPRGSVNSRPNWARLNLDPNEHVVFIYDGAPAHRRSNQGWVLTRSSKCCHLTAHFSISWNRRSARWKRPSRQTFLVQRSKSARITEMKQEIEGSGALGVYRTQLLLEALEQNVTTITAGKCALWHRFMQTYFPRCVSGEAIKG